MIDLARARSHLNLADNETEFDALISGYIASARAFVEMHCDRVIVEAPTDDPAQMELTADVEQAILMLVGHWFANRESVVVGPSSSEVPLGVNTLLWYRKRF